IAVDYVAAGYDRFFKDDPDARNPLLQAPTSGAGLRRIVELLRGIDALAHTTFTSTMTLLTLLPQLRSAYPELAARVQRHVDLVASRDLRVTECITDAKGHRQLPPSKQADPDAYLRIVERRPD